MIATDTLLGVVGLAFNKKVVERIYKIKSRTKTKPFIILISSLKDLGRFGIRPNQKTRKILKKYWPGRFSLILPCPGYKFKYLHRGRKNLAFRLPAKKSLIKILKEIGPLVAPSANPEGKKPARNIREARKYFGKKVDFYQIGKQRKRAKASTLIKLEEGRELILRK